MFDFFKKKPVEDAAKATEKAAEKTTEKSVATPEIAPVTIAEPASFTQRLKQSLSKTRNLLGGQLASLFGGGKIDAETYEELETILLTSDIGVAATHKLLDNLKKRVKRENLDDTSALKSALKADLSAEVSSKFSRFTRFFTLSNSLCVAATPISDVSKMVSSSS